MTTFNQKFPARERDERLDKTRLILIWLVVFGHTLELCLAAHPVFDAIYFYIYSFHMPAFVMLAGMTSPSKLTRKRLRSLWSKLIVPLLIFTLLYESFHFLITGEVSIYITNKAPYWLLWFLLSLVIWRLTLPLLLKLPFPVTLSFILAMLIGLLHPIDGTFSLSRTVFFLPFFILGHCLYSGRYKLSFDNLMARVSFGGAVIYMLVLGVILYWMSSDMSVKLFYGSKPYTAFDANMHHLMMLRATILALATLSIFAIIRIASNLPRLPYINPQNTLWVYLWHGFAFVFIAEGLNAETLNRTISTPLALLIVIGFALLAWLICCALSRPFLARGSNAMVAKISLPRAPQ